MDLLFVLFVEKVLTANVVMLMETCQVWKEEELACSNHLEYQEGKEGSWWKEWKRMENWKLYLRQ